MIKGLTDIHIFHRYDVSGLDDAAFEAAKNMIFSEPPVDAVYDTLPTKEGDTVLAVEYLPGQYDQRADSAVQCLQMLTMKNDSLVRTAQVIVLSGSLSAEDIDAVKHYCINPVESREASLEPAESSRRTSATKKNGIRRLPKSESSIRTGQTTAVIRRS